MIGHDRLAVRFPRVPLLAVACLSANLLLPGCSGIRQAIGLDRVGPDEFAVESRAPLTIPPEFDLRPPQPGAPRPQEASSADKARKVIDTAGPGEPGKQAPAIQIPEGAIGGAAPDASQQVGDQSLAKKLLGSNDSTSGGAVDKRETTPLKGVY
ncbi:MAG TPA: DUF3035 domain-containing protein [Stellaceae bacterium]|nr:DUF3035 domain-containing protein [Stellaceae bacterium]